MFLHRLQIIPRSSFLKLLNESICLLVVGYGESGQFYAPAEAYEILYEGAFDQLDDFEWPEGWADYLENVRI